MHADIFWCDVQCSVEHTQQKEVRGARSQEQTSFRGIPGRSISPWQRKQKRVCDCWAYQAGTFPRLGRLLYPSDAAVLLQGCQSFQAGSSIKVRCRQEDESVVKSAIAKVGNVTFDNNYILKSFASTFTSEWCVAFLLPRRSHPFACSLGGVILSNSHNNVIVDQTFNARLTVCFERAVPVLKPMLFGGGGSKHFD